MLVTDHQAFSYAFLHKYLHGRLARWLDSLVEYDIEVDCLPWKSNQAADFLLHQQKDSMNPTANYVEEGDLIFT